MVEVEELLHVADRQNKSASESNVWIGCRNIPPRSLVVAQLTRCRSRYNSQGWEKVGDNGHCYRSIDVDDCQDQILLPIVCSFRTDDESRGWATERTDTGGRVHGRLSTRQ